MTERSCVNTPDAPEAIGPYCQANLAGPYLLTAAILGSDPSSDKLPEGGIKRQTEQAIDNLQAILRAGGCELDDVAKVTAYLADLEDREVMNKVYGTRFREPYPARSILQTPLPGGAKVAFDAIALRQPPDEEP